MRHHSYLLIMLRLSFVFAFSLTHYATANWSKRNRTNCPLFRPTCFSKHSFADSDGLGDGDRSHTQPSNRYNPEGRELDSLSK